MIQNDLGTPIQKALNQEEKTIPDWNSYLANGDIDMVLEQFSVNTCCKNGFTPLHWAAFNGDLCLVKKLVEKGSSLNSRSIEGFTALHSTAKKRSIDSNSQARILEFLLSKGAQVDSRDENGDTPLIWASTFGHINAVRTLIKFGANPNLKNIQRSTALHWAARKGHRDIVEYLISKGAIIDVLNSCGNTPLIWAGVYNKPSVLRILVENGADPKIENKYFRSVLHFVSWKGNSEVVENLINIGSQVNAQDKFGNTPLNLAARRGKANLVAELLERECDVNHLNKIKLSSLHLASFGGKFGVVQKILESETTDVNLRGQWGSTAIHQAVFNKAINSEVQIKIVNALVQHGAIVDSIDDGGDTPLVWALSDGHIDLVKMLLKLGASTIVRNKFGASMLHWAAYSGQQDKVKVLVKTIKENITDKGKFDANVKDNEGCTPLFWAIEAINTENAENTDYEKIVEVLLKNGACVNRRDKLGLTPLHWAGIKGHENIFNILIDRGACKNALDNKGHTPLQLLAASQT